MINLALNLALNLVVICCVNNSVLDIKIKTPVHI